MALVLTICYSAPGLGDLDDEIIVISEDESFKVPIIARSTPPEFHIETPIVTPPCWVGVKSERLIKCSNLGGIVSID